MMDNSSFNGPLGITTYLKRVTSTAAEMMEGRKNTTRKKPDNATFLYR